MIILLGYMGCGKSSIGEFLNNKYSLNYCDLDSYIENHEDQTIADIFKTNGEIYFRKIEHQYLNDILDKNKVDVLALGGGTPCYANNMELIRKYKAKSIYLKLSLEILTERLFLQKSKRPLIKDITSRKQMKDFIRKHLFEREFYYRQADEVVDVSGLTIERIAKKLLKIAY